MFFFLFSKTLSSTLYPSPDPILKLRILIFTFIMRKDFIAKGTYLFNLTQPGLDVHSFQKIMERYVGQSHRNISIRSLDNVRIAVHRSITNWACSTICNLFVTSKNETMNSPIHEFKVLHKDKRAF